MPTDRDRASLWKRAAKHLRDQLSVDPNVTEAVLRWRHRAYKAEKALSRISGHDLNDVVRIVKEDGDLLDGDGKIPFVVRLKPEERDALVDTAHAEGLTVSGWLVHMARRAAVGKRTIELDDAVCVPKAEYEKLRRLASDGEQARLRDAAHHDHVLDEMLRFLETLVRVYTKATPDPEQVGKVAEILRESIARDSNYDYASGKPWPEDWSDTDLVFVQQRADGMLWFKVRPYEVSIHEGGLAGRLRTLWKAVA